MKSFGARSRGLRLERMTASPRWNGEGFRNVHPIPPSLRDPAAPFPTAREFLRTGPPRYPEAPLASVDPRATWLRAPASGLRITWLGHSTLLIEIDGVRLLTDPVWGDRASPFQLFGPKRFQPAPVRLRDMPRAGRSADLARPLRPSRLPDRSHARAAQCRADGHVAGRRRASRGVGRGRRAHHGARLVGVASVAGNGGGRHRGAVAALLRDAGSAIATRRSGRRSRSARRGTPSSSAATPASRPSTPRSATASAPSTSRCSRSARGILRGATFTWGRTTRFRRTPGSAAARCCRSTGARSTSATHAVGRAGRDAAVARGSTQCPAAAAEARRGHRTAHGAAAAGLVAHACRRSRGAGRDAA